jgi:hypothetical protein
MARSDVLCVPSLAAPLSWIWGGCGFLRIDR